MRIIKSALLGLLALSAAFGQVVPGSGGVGGTITGQIQTATGGGIARGTLTFSLSQPAILANSASIATQQIACYTSAAGNIAGVPDPNVLPIVSVNTSSGTLAAGTYYVKLFYAAVNGTSASSGEVAITLGSQGSVIVNAPVLQPGSATGYGVAIGTTSGGETIQNTITGWGQFTQASPLFAGGVAPTVNTSTCNIYFSDQLVPTGTYYTVNLVNRNGAQVSGFPQSWCTYGGAGATINVSQGAPTGNCNTSGVFYPTPIFSNNSTGAGQSINTPITFNSGVTFNGATSGTFTSLCAQQLGTPTNNIQLVGCGTNTTIQIALNALPSTGGKVLIPPGTYAISDVTLNQANTVLEGSGPSTIITPVGGAGHWGVILGSPDPSNVAKMAVRNLAVTCPGGTDLTGGILIRKGVAVQNLVDSVQIRGCAVGINVGETGFTLNQSAFGNTINNVDIEVTGSQVGILVGQADGTNIINSAVRDSTDIANVTNGTSIGVHVIGPAARTVIENDYIEFIPGGDIVLDTSSGVVQSTFIDHDYMETYGANGSLLTIGSGVLNTFYDHIYSNSNASPSATYDIQIADGVQNVNIGDVRLQNRNTANIHNLNSAGAANILLSNIDLTSSTSPLIDSMTGVEVKTFATSSGGTNPTETILANNPLLALQAFNAGGFKQLLFEEPSSGATQLNWCVGVGCDHTTNLFEIAPSTTNGGSTYTTPVESCVPATCTFSTQIASTLSTGTAPFSVTSTTPVATLVVSNHPKVVNCTNTAACAANAELSGFLVHGTIALTGGAKTVTALPFTGVLWTCTTSDTTTAGNGSSMVEASATTATVTGTGTDVIAYICAGK